ncbi:MAG: MerR family DNA-binding transcriptional regulator [Deltaproteobacteria bacterium]|nr:MerR family DNA-binding transcriptional regulator [Deltaproteobacteria bacterium]MBT6432706.1 MerR family DNA-binding transcriptional regulator [Deltaproteobacteria bacterium]
MAHDRLTTADAAKIAGVATSTIKRWADQGLLRFTRTAGGHRRYARGVLEKMLSAEDSVVVAPWVSDWIECLEQAQRYEIDGRLLGARSRLGSWAGVVDELTEVVGELDRRWMTGEMTGLDQRSIRESLKRGLNRVADGLPVALTGPRCLLACAEGEESDLGISLAELALRECGWQPVWLGCGAPLAEVIRVLRESEIEMVCVTASSMLGSPTELRSFAAQFEQACSDNGSRLILTGLGSWPLKPDYGTRLKSWDAIEEKVTALNFKR